MTAASCFLCRYCSAGSPLSGALLRLGPSDIHDVASRAIAQSRRCYAATVGQSTPVLAQVDHTTQLRSGTKPDERRQSSLSMHTALELDEKPHDKRMAVKLLSRLRHNVVKQAANSKPPATQQPHAERKGRHTAVVGLSETIRSKDIRPAASTAVAQTVENIQFFQREQLPLRPNPHCIDDPVKIKLHQQLCNILAEAQAQPHWSSNPTGFRACLDNVELLFRRLFFPTEDLEQQPPAKSTAVQPTQDNVSHCINTVLPVLLLPKQSPALNITEVAEFLQDMLQMSGKAVFHCLCQEPAILYLDLYTDLLPMHEYLHSLHWDPAVYRHIIVRSAAMLCNAIMQWCCAQLQ